MKVLLFDAINAAQVALGFVSTILNVINVVLVLGESYRVVHAPVGQSENWQPQNRMRGNLYAKSFAR